MGFCRLVPVENRALPSLVLEEAQILTHPCTVKLLSWIAVSERNLTQSARQTSQTHNFRYIKGVKNHCHSPEVLPLHPKLQQTRIIQCMRKCTYFLIATVPTFLVAPVAQSQPSGTAATASCPSFLQQLRKIEAEHSNKSTVNTLSHNTAPTTWTLFTRQTEAQKTAKVTKGNRKTEEFLVRGKVCRSYTCCSGARYWDWKTCSSRVQGDCTIISHNSTSQLFWKEIRFLVACFGQHLNKNTVTDLEGTTGIPVSVTTRSLSLVLSWQRTLIWKTFEGRHFELLPFMQHYCYMHRIIFWAQPHVSYH